MTTRLVQNNRWPFQREPDEDEGDLPQPFAHRLELPHDEYDGENQYDNGQYPYGFEDGDPRVTEPCWGQHPGGSTRKGFYNPSRRWGDRRVIAIQAVNKVPSQNVPISNGGLNPNQTTYASPNTTLLTGQLLDLKLVIPAVCVVYLSAVDLSGILTATDPGLWVEWTIDMGCGRANQQKIQKQLVAPFDNSSITIFQFQQPLQSLRVSAQVFDTIAGLTPPIYEVECVATCAPFSIVTPEMVAP